MQVCALPQIICKVITGWRPQVPPGAPEGFADLMTACWYACSVTLFVLLEAPPSTYCYGSHRAHKCAMIPSAAPASQVLAVACTCNWLG